MTRRLERRARLVRVEDFVSSDVPEIQIPLGGKISWGDDGVGEIVPDEASAPRGKGWIRDLLARLRR